MKKLLLLAFTLSLALLFSFSFNAAAGSSMNMKNLTCQELLSEDDDSIGIILIWVDGYLSGVTGDTTFDAEYMEQFGFNVGEACTKSPTAKVLDVARIVGIQN